MRRFGIFIGLLASTSAAHAADKVLYQPAPSWVKPAPAIDPTKLGDDGPVLLLLDNQQRLQDGQVWTYLDTASRAASAQTMTQLGTVQLPWQPAQGDLIIHRAEIIRGGEHIDLIKGGDPFSVLRREEKLGQRQLDGMLTATMAVPGLQVGDVLHLTFSVTRKDPTLKGDLQTGAPLLTDPVRVGFARDRLIWPVGSDVRWRAYIDGVTAQPVTVDGYRELSVTLPLPKPAERPNDAPIRFQTINLLEATTFKDWAAVSKTMAPLYATDGTIAPGSPLAAEVARIMAAETDPLKRTALALQLVQEKISYLLLGMETGNYVPQSPGQTWAARYGDCKAKTLLLLALLHAMKIEAEPVLASSKGGDMVPSRLPGAAAFDHVLVRANVGGETLWLDGTDGGARFADIHDTPAFGSVLPIRPGGADLIHIPLHPDVRPDLTIAVELDETAGLTLPAAFTSRMTVRGALGELFRAAAAQGTKDDLDGMAERLVRPYLGDEAVVASRVLAFDPAMGTATLTATGIAYPDWTRDNGRLRYPLDKSVSSLNFSPDRARPAWRDLPVATGNPGSLRLTTRILLPRGGTGFTVDGPDAYDDTLAGQRITRRVSQQGNVLTVDEFTVATGAEVAVADIPATKQKVALAKAKLPYVRAAADYPGYAGEITGTRDPKPFAALGMLYAGRIADKPDDRSRYTDRAWFEGRALDRKAQVADLTKAIAIEPTVDSYLDRSRAYSVLGDDAKALADAQAARTLDPSSDDALGRLTYLQTQQGQATVAIAAIQAKVDEGGKDKYDFMSSKADLQALNGDYTGAVATLDEAIAAKPGDPSLLNARCWIKGTGNIALDTALKDCTKAIELADDASPALDSRAMVYFRLGRLDDASADLDSALTANPDQASSIYLRGIIARRQGKTAAGDADLAMARTVDPLLERRFKRYGILP